MSGQVGIRPDGVIPDTAQAQDLASLRQPPRRARSARHGPGKCREGHYLLDRSRLAAPLTAPSATISSAPVPAPQPCCSSPASPIRRSISRSRRKPSPDRNPRPSVARNFTLSPRGDVGARQRSGGERNAAIQSGTPAIAASTASGVIRAIPSSPAVLSGGEAIGTMCRL